MAQGWFKEQCEIAEQAIRDRPSWIGEAMTPESRINLPEKEPKQVVDNDKFYDYSFHKYRTDFKELYARTLIDVENLHIFAIHRGGLPLGVHYSNISGRPLNIIKYQRLDGDDTEAEILIGPDIIRPDDKILVLDDIYDSGETFRVVKQMLLKRGVKEENLQLYALFGSDNADGVEYIRDYPDKWVRFPWEMI